MTDPERLVTWAEHERQMRRQDNIEGQFARLERERLRVIQGDIAALRRSIEKLVAAQGSDDGQPDWIECRHPAVAEDMLLGIHDWTTRYAEPLGVDLIGCWPWHSAAVSLLLAAKEHHQAVMEGDRPADRMDFELRIIPSLGKRIRDQITAKCNDDQHRPGRAGRPVYRYDVGQLRELAWWWATDRFTLAPGLTPWDE